MQLKLGLSWKKLVKGRVKKNWIHTETKKAAMNWGLKEQYKPVRFFFFSEYSAVETVQICNSPSPFCPVSSLLLIEHGVRNAAEFDICWSMNFSVVGRSWKKLHLWKEKQKVRFQQLLFETFLLKQAVGSGMKLSPVCWAQEQVHSVRV